MSETARPELLVDGDWLEARSDAPNLRVVDCEGAAAYRRAHIPGAVFSEAHPYKGEDRRLVMPPEDFATAMSALGIGPETTVVAYEAGAGASAGRLWWSLSYFGHQDVRFLDGGWPRWLAEGRPITMADSKPAPATFVPHIDESLLATADYVRAAIDNPDVIILDVRSDGEWDGSDARGNPRPGHIPGSVHLENRLSMTADEAGGLQGPGGAEAALRVVWDHTGQRGDHALTGWRTLSAVCAGPEAPGIRAGTELRRLFWGVVAVG